MDSKVRYIVWLAVVAASVGVGYYLNTADERVALPPTPTTPGKYVFVAGGSDAYWELCVAGAMEAAKKLDAELEVRTPTGEGEAGLKEQLEWLGGELAVGSDGVAVGPIDPIRQTTLINSLAERTTVVTVDSDCPGSRRMFYVGSSNYEAGGIAAQMVRDAMPGGGKVAVLLATLTKTNAAERKQGFEEALLESESDDDSAGAADYTIVPTEMDLGSLKRCADIVKKTIEDHPDLGAFVCTFGYHGPIALETLGAIEGGDAVKVIAFDEDKRVLEGIRSGRVHATIAQDPFMFGYEAIRMLDEVRSGQYLALPVAGRVDVGVHCIPVNQANLDDFQVRLAQRLGEGLGAQEAAAESTD